MEMKLELVVIPVTDVDRARDFYKDKVGFNLDQAIRLDGIAAINLGGCGVKKHISR